VGSEMCIRDSVTREPTYAQAVGRQPFGEGRLLEVEPSHRATTRGDEPRPQPLPDRSGELRRAPLVDEVGGRKRRRLVAVENLAHCEADRRARGPGLARRPERPAAAGEPHEEEADRAAARKGPRPRTHAQCLRRAASAAIAASSKL